MGEVFAFIEDVIDIRQGDIIRKRDPLTWGVVLTADCDLAKRKAGEQYTWLEIITLREYLETQWAAETLGKQIRKESKRASDALNELITKAGLSLGPLSPESTCDWIAKASNQEILEALNCGTDFKDRSLITTFDALRLALTPQESETHLSCLRKLWTTLGRNEATFKKMIDDAFKGGGEGFPDYVMVPTLPDTEGHGFIVQLRWISTISQGAVFKTEADARVNGQPDAFHRIGRFSDRIKFSISQKLAFLFSRIGMTNSFESACATAMDCTVASILAPPAKASK